MAEICRNSGESLIARMEPRRRRADRHLRLRIREGLMTCRQKQPSERRGICLRLHQAASASSRRALPDSGPNHETAMMEYCRCFARRVNVPAYRPLNDATHKPLRRNVQAIEMTMPGYCAWGCFLVFCLDASNEWPLPDGERPRLTRYARLDGAPYSQDHVEKSFSYCGTSFQTPFSFLAVMVISCG